MKIVALSDLHGHLPEIPECDLLLLAGDLCPLRDHSAAYQAAWLDSAFRDWLQNAPARHIVGVAGNHDFIFERAPGLIPADLPWTYLQDSGCEIDGLRIWGTPWQPPFFDWAFNAPEPRLQKIFGMIPDGTDIVICHGPPYGQGDRTQRAGHVGSRSLLRAVRRVRPQLLICGHIHPAHGAYRIGPTSVINASHVNESYEPVHAPWTLNLKDCS